MTKLVKIWEERKYGPKFAICSVIAILAYLVITR
jgi:hypothetical protein